MAWVTVLIKMNGVNITNKTQSTIVGRQIPLTGEVIGGTPTTKSWSVPGSPIKNYTASSVSAKVTNLSSADLQGSSVAFYWVNGGSGREVKYTVTVNGQIYSGKTTFNVVRPSCTLTTSTGEVHVSDNRGSWWLSFGDPVPNTPGIIFTSEGSIPGGFTGYLAYAQVLTSTLHRRQTEGGQWYRKSGSQLCDGQFPYSSIPPPVTDDSPGESLTSDCVVVSADDAFSMYVIFKPSGTGSIWVPLRKVNWWWEGTAVRSDSQWDEDDLWYWDWSLNPGSTNCTDPPEWSGNSHDLGWVPE